MEFNISLNLSEFKCIFTAINFDVGLFESELINNYQPWEQRKGFFKPASQKRLRIVIVLINFFLFGAFCVRGLATAIGLVCTVCVHEAFAEAHEGHVE